MSYKSCIQFLNQQLPMFAKQGGGAMKKGLHNITALCHALGNPQNDFKSIHVAGTNGKGSVCHMLAAALQKCGYKTGLYTSPHLIDFRERFRINGNIVSQQFVIDFLNKNRALIFQIRPSYFELTVALAFSYFKEQNVDIAIIETGLGGQLDSTNIIKPILSVITQIGMDHIDILGDTIEKIAVEKAGIIKEGIPVVIGDNNSKTKPIFYNTANQKNATSFLATDIWRVSLQGLSKRHQHLIARNKTDSTSFALRTDLLGIHQYANFRTALAAISILQKLHWQLPIHDVIQSFATIKTKTGLRGRWDKIQLEPKIILDCAHNKDGITRVHQNILLERLKQDSQVKIIIGFVKDKDIDNILPLLPKYAFYYFTQAEVPRALPADQLFEKAQMAGLNGIVIPKIEDAISSGKQSLNNKDLLLITGSCFVVGEALSIFHKMKKTSKRVKV